MTSTRTLSAFFIAPQSQRTSAVRRVISDALQAEGITLSTVDDIVRPGQDWLSTVQSAIERSDIIIADLTGSNPNVMYELGFAQALRKPVLPIVHEGEASVTAAVSGSVFLVYSSTRPDRLQEQIRYWTTREMSSL